MLRLTSAGAVLVAGLLGGTGCSSDSVSSDTGGSGGVTGGAGTTGGAAGAVAGGTGGAPGGAGGSASGSGGAGGLTGGTGGVMMCHIDCFTAWRACRDGVVYEVMYGFACVCGACNLNLCQTGMAVEYCTYGCAANGIDCATQPDPGDGGAAGTAAGGAAGIMGSGGNAGGSGDGAAGASGSAGATAAECVASGMCWNTMPVPYCAPCCPVDPDCSDDASLPPPCQTGYCYCSCQPNGEYECAC
jgi:hypothetical protein